MFVLLVGFSFFLLLAHESCKWFLRQTNEIEFFFVSLSLLPDLGCAQNIFIIMVTAAAAYIRRMTRKCGSLLEIERFPENEMGENKVDRN